MMKYKLRLQNLILASILVLGLLTSYSLPAAAHGYTKFPTIITFVVPTNIVLGKVFIVTGTVKLSNGTLLAYKDIQFSLDGKVVGRSRTNTVGVFQRKFVELNAGTHTITAVTTTNHNAVGVTTSTSFNVASVEVSVKVVPPIAGVPFDLGGVKFFSGPDGVASVLVATAGKYQLTVLLNQFQNPDQRITFARWMDETAKPYTLIQVPSTKPIELGVNVFEQVGETFVDLNGFPVSASRVAQFTIRSAQGDIFKLTNGNPQWIPSSRVVRFQNGLAVTPLLYSVTNLMVDGSNVVNRSQQQFYSHPNDTWKIALILYTLNVRANDGLFGSTVGKSVNLVYPDGKTVNYPFSAQGTIGIHGLARGNYTVQVLDAKGLRQIIPVALSHSQTVDIKVPTSLDIFVLLSLGLLFVVGLILFGRRRQIFVARVKPDRPLVARHAQNTLVRVEEQSISDQEKQPASDGMIKWS
jgi:hypothetical protein